jgi:DNA-binding GntR family transcriptional regulator
MGKALPSHRNARPLNTDDPGVRASVETSALRWANTALSHLPPLTRALANEIIAGQRAIGSMLPAEHELCEAHGLSRYAVREAMIQLQELGLIDKRRGIGTRVVADRPRDHHLYRLDTTADLIEFTRGTELLISDRRIVTIDHDSNELAWTLADDHPWLRIRGTRYVAGTQIVVSVDTAFLHAKYASLLKQGGRLDANIFVLIERQCGLSPKKVEQEVKATLIPPEQAKILHVAPNSAGLVVSRQFHYDEGVLVVTKSVHPADSFSYSTTYRITPSSKSHPSRKKPGAT